MNPTPMIIDCFAGGGGASTGIEEALGRSPDVAINHSAPALALHAANHPDTIHLDSNIWDVEPRAVTGGRPVGLLWASPDCKHFSKAKGGAPKDRNVRDLAWVVVRWAEDVRPDVILLENVEEFRTWGPIGNDGQPIKELAGIEFERWSKRLRQAGYRMQWRELRACDYGAPTIRKRFFMIARRDGRRIVWPKPTHGDPKSAEVRKGKLQPWRTAAECIDWSLPCPSIFDTSAQILEKHGLRAVRPLAVNTLARVARGMRRYVIDADRPFLVNLTHGARIEDATDPFRTITGAHRGEKAVVVPTIVGCGGRAAQSRARGGDEPFATVTAKADACVATAFLATMRNSQKPWQGASEPTHTITAGGAGLTLIAPSLTRFNGGATGSSMDDPAPTVTANSWIKKPGGAAPLGILAPYLAELGHGETAKTGAKRWGFGSKPLGDPLATITAGGKSHALVAPVLTYAQQGGGCRSAEAPHHTICASSKDQNSLIAATMVHVGNGERAGQRPRALDVCAPLNTVVAGGVKHYPVAAWLAQQNGGPRMDGHAGRDPRDPLSTVTASGAQQTPVAAWLAKWFKTPQDPRVDEPLHTITTKPRFDVETATLAAPPFGPEHHARAREVAEFLRAHDAWAGGEYVTLTIDGAEFVVVDIGLRMLTPRELFAAQGFPADYVIEGVWEGMADGDMSWRPFPKDVQVSCCGNSVCPPLAEAIVRANCGHLAVQHHVAEAQDG